MAGSMRRRGMSIDSIEAALAIENAARCDPPLPESEVRAIAASIGRYAPGAPAERLSSFDSCIRTPIQPQFPRDPDPAIYQGIAGDFVYLIEEHTETSSVGLLVSFLVEFGSVIGRGAYFQVEATRHYANEFAALVGETSRGRKGTAGGHVRTQFHGASAGIEWFGKWVTRHASGLSSGEGLIHEIRDPVYAAAKQNKKGARSNEVDEQSSAPVCVDEGELDKRLMVVEEELASAIAAMDRQGNTLSPVLRRAWDSPDVLRTMTKASRSQASLPHISVIGHITADELRRRLTTTEAASGFANRWLYVAVRRSKQLPFGAEGLATVNFGPVQRSLREAVAYGYNLSRDPNGRRFGMSPEARELWAAEYPRLTSDAPGIVGAVTARSEAHALRFALLYAVMDKSRVIERTHLDGAIALVDYAAASARYIWGDRIGDTDADTVLDALQAGPLTRTEISIRVFNRNVSADRITRALGLLQRHRLIRVEMVNTDGRPAERWTATEATP
jgi:hypothetical protein